MKYPAVIKVNLEEETARLAEEFTAEIGKGDVIVFKGDLGAGKTFFIKNMLKKYGIKNVNSPTFAIVNEYQNSMIFYHFDFYRLKEEKELFDIGFQDYMSNREAVKLIEWGGTIPFTAAKEKDRDYDSF